mgnify:CR=1 FL=1
MNIGDRLLVDGWEQLPPSAESLAAAEACAKLPLAFISSGKPFLRKLFKEGCENIPPELLRLAEDKDIVAAVEAYFGEAIKVASLRLFHSVYVPAAPYKSQLYHCDGGPLAMVKLLLHCSDVTPKNGPFSFLPLDTSAELWAKTNYSTDRRLTDAQVEDAIGKIEPTHALGPKGTMFLLDTAKLFHFGARVDKGAANRLVAFVQYVKASDTFGATYDETAGA